MWGYLSVSHVSFLFLGRRLLPAPSEVLGSPAFQCTGYERVVLVCFRGFLTPRNLRVLFFLLLFLCLRESGEEFV